MQRTTSYLCLRIDKSSEMTWREVENGKRTTARGESRGRSRQNDDQTYKMAWTIHVVRSFKHRTWEAVHTAKCIDFIYYYYFFGVGEIGDRATGDDWRRCDIGPTSTQYLLWNVWQRMSRSSSSSRWTMCDAIFAHATLPIMVKLHHAHTTKQR